MKVPNHTQIPNEILDGMADLSETELRVILAVCRKTIGWHKDTDSISLSQIEQLTGLSLNGIRAGVAGLIDKRMIRVDRSGAGRGTVTSYTVDFDNGAANAPIRPIIGATVEPLPENNGATSAPTKESKTKKKKEEKESGQGRRFTDRFWERYAEHCNGAKPTYLEKYRKMVPRFVDGKDTGLVDRAVDAYFDRKWWFAWDRVNRCATWTLDGFMAHFDEIVSGLMTGKAAERTMDDEYMERHRASFDRIFHRTGGNGDGDGEGGGTSGGGGGDRPAGQPSGPEVGGDLFGPVRAGDDRGRAVGPGRPGA